MLYYHTATQEYAVRGSLAGAEKQLAAYHFARCNQCYLVNLQYVRGVENDFVQVGDARLGDQPSPESRLYDGGGLLSGRCAVIVVGRHVFFRAVLRWGRCAGVLLPAQAPGTVLAPGRGAAAVPDGPDLAAGPHGPEQLAGAAAGPPCWECTSAFLSCWVP